MIRIIKAILTLLLKPTIPHEMGHATVLHWLGEEVTSITFGNPDKKLFSFGIFHIGAFSIEYGGLVETKEKDRSKFAPWQRVAISFAGPFMDIASLSITMATLYASFLIFGYGTWLVLASLYQLWLIVSFSTQSMNLLPRTVGEIKSDGLKIKEASLLGFVLSWLFVILGFMANIIGTFLFFYYYTV